MYSGKRTDVVDFGGETDYSDVKWFQDPPQRNRVSFLAGWEPPCSLLMYPSNRP